MENASDFAQIWTDDHEGSVELYQWRKGRKRAINVLEVVYDTKW